MRKIVKIFVENHNHPLLSTVKLCPLMMRSKKSERVEYSRNKTKTPFSWVKKIVAVSRMYAYHSATFLDNLVNSQMICCI